MDDSPENLPEVDLTAKDAVTSTCEYCGLKYWILPSHEDGAIAHETPGCPDFSTMDAIEFIRRNNKIKLARLDKNKPKA
jgi:hypothetical protein